MNKRLAAVFCVGLVTGIAATVAAVAWSGNTLASGKNSSRVLLENERVRVREALFMPGEKPGMHTHDLPHVGVIIDGGTLKFNSPDGKVETLELPRGAVGYRDANVTHEPINPGKTPIRVIEVEIK
jgi:mannose-6-phosphate isomerase-like protein (cupin superfamily)